MALLRTASHLKPDELEQHSPVLGGLFPFFSQKKSHPLKTR